MNRILATCILILQLVHAGGQETLRKHITYLCSDELEGRYPGTRGDSLTEVYIAAHFQEAGLKFLPGFTGYRQFFPVLQEIRFESVFKVKTADSMWTPEAGRDYHFYSSSPGCNLQTAGIFLGYGPGDTPAIPASTCENTAGKMVFSYARILADTKGGVVPFAQKQIKASYQRRLESGAAILVDVVPDSVFSLPRAPNRVRSIRPFPYLRMTRSAFLRIAGKDRLEKLEESMRMDTLPVVAALEGTEFELRAERSEIYNHSANIAGLLPGREKPYIVIGAHHDHLGVGKDGEIRRGADDNASGVALLIELANALKDSCFRYGIVFAAFGAEEKGMIGSFHFLEHFSPDTMDIMLMINLDMLGRPQDRELWFEEMNVPPGSQSLMPVLSGGNLKLKKGPGGISDHLPFYRAGIHTLYFTTGFHEDVHTSSDLPEKTDPKGMQEILYWLVSLVSLLSETPQFSIN